MPHSSNSTPASLPASELVCEGEGGNEGETERVLEGVERYIGRAVALLHSLGPKYHRAAWLLEDTLAFVSVCECDGGEFGEHTVVSSAPLF